MLQRRLKKFIYRNSLRSAIHRLEMTQRILSARQEQVSSRCKIYIACAIIKISNFEVQECMGQITFWLKVLAKMPEEGRYVVKIRHSAGNCCVTSVTS